MPNDLLYTLQCCCEQQREFQYKIPEGQKLEAGSTTIQVPCPYPWCDKRMSVEIPKKLPSTDFILKSKKID